MAKTTISSADQALLRSQHHYINDIRLNIFKPSEVATATVNSTPDTNPVSQLTVTGDVSATVVGQRFIIRDSSDNIVTHGTLRKATSSQTLNISPVSIGDSGYVEPIKRAISATDTITVYADRPLWGDYSRIVANTFRKKWDVAYSDENEDVPPIANAGASQSIRIETGGSGTFTLPRSGANDSFTFGSKTISSYLWSLPTGVTLVGGYSASDSVIEVTATQGQHIISLTVTDSNGKTHTAYTYLFVNDGTNYRDLFDEYAVTIESDTQDLDGRTLTFTVRGNNLADTFYPASYVHLQHDSLYGGSALTTGVDVDTFVGYITDYQYSHNGSYGQATITAVSPYLYLKQVFMPPQVINDVANPSNWQEVTEDLANPQGALSYIRWHCQNLFAMHDIDTNDITTPLKFSFEFNRKSIAGGLQVASDTIIGNVGSASDGTLVLRHNPNFEDNTFRNALAVGMTFSASDIIAPMEHPKSVIPPYADIRFGAFTYNGNHNVKTGVKAFYGTKRWSQGVGETVLPDFAVTPAQGKDGVLEKIGHVAGDLQYPLEQPITFARNINVIDPVYMIWYQLNVTSDFDPSGEGWSNQRFLTRRITRTWDNDNRTLAIQATIKRETFGQKADEWIIGSGQTVMSGGWVTDYAIDYAPTNNNFSALPNVALAINTSGDLAITQTFTNATPTWDSLNDLITGSVNDICYDYNSAFFTSGYVLTEPLSVYIVSASGTTLYVYRLFDIKASTLEIELLTTYTMNDSSSTTNARIQCSQTTGTLAVVAWHDQTGVLFGRTTNGGSTWASAVQVGDSITDTDNDNASIGLYISGTNQVITAPNSSGDYGTYLATTAGGSFSKLTNSEDNTAPQPMITGDGVTTLYVATDNDGTGSGSGGGVDYTVDFDAGFGAYSVSATDMGSSDTGTGNTGNCAVGTKALSDSNFVGSVVVEITLTDVETVTQVDFDWWHNAEVLSNDSFGFANTLPLKCNVTIDDNSTSIIYNPTPTTVDTGGSTSGSGDPYTGFTYNETWQTFSHTPASPVADSKYVNVFFGSVGTSCRFGFPSSTLEYRIDNIKVYTSDGGGGGGGSPLDPALYKVTTYTATDSWTDVTPDTDYIPQLPYGLATDIADSANVEVFATDDSTPKYFQSDDTASTYTDNGASDYRTGKRIGDSIIYGGVDALDLSLDGGTTVNSRLGNLGVVWGSVGTVKNVLVLV